MRTKFKPTYTPGDRVRLKRSLPPALSGSIATVIDIHTGRNGAYYQVQPLEYPSRPVWAYEEDLEWVLPSEY